MSVNVYTTTDLQVQLLPSPLWSFTATLEFIAASYI
jgi:hypothetical protein